MSAYFSKDKHIQGDPPLKVKILKYLVQLKMPSLTFQNESIFSLPVIIKCLIIHICVF